MNSLNSHPEINSCYELLDETLEGVNEDCREIIFKTFGLNLPNSGFMTMDQRDQVSDCLYVEKVFEKYNFVKFLYDHIIPYKNLTNYIKNLKDLKIIHLKRKDVFASYISSIVANRSKLWHVKNEEDKKFLNLKKINISPENALEMFDKIAFQEKVIDSYFKNKSITIYYEDLVDSWDEEITKIQNFFNIENITIDKAIKKSIEIDHRNLVLNLHEIAHHPLLSKHSNLILHGVHAVTRKML